MSIGRFLEAREKGIGGALMAKILLAIPVLLATRWIASSAWYWLTLALAVFMDVGKMLTAVTLKEDDAPQIVRPLMRTGLLGVAALVAWSFVAYPVFVARIPRLAGADYSALGSFLVGLIAVGISR